MQKEIDPDEIFIDSENLPGFNKDQFEGRIEKPISKTAILFLGLFFILIGMIFISKIWELQILDGKEYAEQSAENSLRHKIIFADRGTIYDILGKPLVWNEAGKENEFSTRKYAETTGLSNLLGYVSYPKKDSSGFYFSTEIKGVEGIESSYNDILAGENGLQIVEVNATDEIISESTTNQPDHGKDLTLTIDSEVQKHLYDAIVTVVNENDYEAGGGVIMDIFNGDILALVSYPDYDSNVMSNEKDKNKIDSYIFDKSNPFLNRVISGLYTPGSIVKPYIAVGVLNENIIDPNRKIYSPDKLVIPNPYDPEKPSIFTDLKEHGYIDIREALAVSSNVYFYQV